MQPEELNDACQEEQRVENLIDPPAGELGYIVTAREANDEGAQALSRQE